MIHAKIICDSINELGERITTFVLTYPRFIHAEFMTHRVFSRNAASSRAIPIEKMIQRINDEPAVPIYWGSNKSGMQAGEEICLEHQVLAEDVWMQACADAVQHARSLAKLKVHKQVVNRLLEPFAHMVTLLTATDYANFFNLRCHPDAQPEIQELAYKMLEEYHKGKPQLLQKGEWHLPYGDAYTNGLTLEEKIKVCTARAARVSYVNHEGYLSSLEDDLKLYDRLVVSEPIHASPTEHPAECNPGQRWGNFQGWKQYRKFLQKENCTSVDYNELMNRRCIK